MDKLDKIADRLGAIDVTLARNTVALEEHIKRTNLLETQVGQLKLEFKPVERHVAMVQGALKLIGGGAIVVELVKLIAGR